MNLTKSQKLIKSEYLDFFNILNDNEKINYVFLNDCIYIIKKSDSNMVNLYFNNNIKIPENVKFEDINVSFFSFNNFVLPKNLEINKSLEFIESENIFINDNLKIGVIRITRSSNIKNLEKIKNLNSIFIKKSHNIDLRRIKLLLRDFSIENSFNIKLSKELNVGSNVIINNSIIKSYPKKLYFGNDISLENSNIKTLNFLRKLNNNKLVINLTETKIDALPIKLIKNLYKNTPIYKLSKNDNFNFNATFFASSLILSNNVFYKNLDHIKDENINIMFADLPTDFLLNTSQGFNINNKTFQYCCKNYKKIAESILIYYSTPLHKKLLLEKFKRINKQEIEKIIKKETNIIINNNSKNEIIFNLFDYCQSEQSINFLVEIGYNFKEQELKSIRDIGVKNYYEKTLLKQKYIK